jgi:hypothetical protein
MQNWLVVKQERTIQIGPSEVHATSGANLGWPLFLVFGPSDVRLTSEANLGRPLFLVLIFSCCCCC